MAGHVPETLMPEHDVSRQAVTDGVAVMGGHGPVAVRQGAVDARESSRHADLAPAQQLLGHAEDIGVGGKHLDDPVRLVPP